MQTNRARLNQVNIVSSDLAASISFYRRLGVVIPDEAVWQTQTGIHHVSARHADADLDFDLDSVTFAGIWNSAWSGRQDLSGRVVVGFQLPSRDAVDNVYNDLTGAGHVGLQRPYDAFWGARYAIVQGPDGVVVGLMSPVARDLVSKPPDV
jgi:catechol 2,3-dioxygenase-like lactoylglutathione lyase family enzyme